eukprot:gene3488-1696_t
MGRVRVRGVEGAPATFGEPGQRLAELRDIMREETPGIVGVCETHLDETTLDGLLMVPGYQPPIRCDRDLTRSSRNKRRAGGVLVWVREGRVVDDVDKAARTDFEGVAFTDRTASVRYVFLYRTGAQALCELTDWLQEQFARAPGGRAVVFGDTNMNMRKASPHPRALLTTLRAQPGLSQHVRFPTWFRFSAEGERVSEGSVIDHFWAPFNCRCTAVARLGTLSDHRAVRVHHGHTGGDPPPRRRRAWVRKWNRALAGDGAAKVAAHVHEAMARFVRRQETLSESRRAQAAELQLQQRREAAARLRGRGRYADAAELLGAAQTAHSAHAVAWDAAAAKEVVVAWEAAWKAVKRDFAPRVRVRVRPCRAHLSWLSQGTRAAMRERDRLRRQRDSTLRRAVNAPGDEDQRAAASRAAEQFLAAKRAATPEVVQFADDVTLVVRGSTPAEATARMDDALAQYHAWATSNRISPEPKKTQLLVSASHRRLQQMAATACTMAGARIEPADTIKILGVLVDPQLAWDAHAAVAFGKKQFAWWAPSCITAMLRGDVLRGLQDVDRPAPPPRPPPSPRQQPSDEFAAQRAAYHAEVVRTYQRGGPEYSVPTGEAFAALREQLCKDMSCASLDGEDQRLLRACWGSASFQQQSTALGTPLPYVIRAASTLHASPLPAEESRRRVIVWGDGSADLAQQVAGSGIYYGHDNDRNRAIRCPGKPSNQRGELFAFVHCLRTEDRPFLYVTDSTYVHDGVTDYRPKWRAKAWFKHPQLAEYMSHADLWQEVDSRMRARPAHYVLTMWCRGHARREQAAAGETTAIAGRGGDLPRGEARCLEAAFMFPPS